MRPMPSDRTPMCCGPIRSHRPPITRSTNGPSARSLGALLVAFLRARLDEDEQVANAATGGPWRQVGMTVRGQTRMNGNDVLVVQHTWPQESAHMVRHDPARVLREVEAKRTIVALAVVMMKAIAHEYEAKQADRILCVFAAIYAEHPDYRAEWAPSSIGVAGSH